ncbi:MAG: adenine phosphoribosyltransferase, partial [Gemmatimonadaceae bacterium]|nr:adenine phosphoribosyltransferase [Gemmatimonadaceae bacterium]
MRLPHDPALAGDLANAIRTVPDFPKPGVAFKDITPVLAAPELFGRTVAALAAPWRGEAITHVLGVESRGFIFGAPAALALGAAFVPVRKPGKLPRERLVEAYALEYGSDQVELHADAIG